MNSREQIIRLQGQVDKQYAGLKDMAEERKRKLENMYHLFQLKREADDLEQWIAEKELVASSPEMGQDFDHVTVRTHGAAFFVFLSVRSPPSRHTRTPACLLQSAAQGCRHSSGLGRSGEGVRAWHQVAKAPAWESLPSV